MVLCEIHANEADVPRSHVDSQAEGDVWRVLRVMQHVRIRKVRPALHAQLKLDDIGMWYAEIKLREEIFRLGGFDVMETITGKLLARIDHDEIVGLEASPDIVDADGNELLGVRKLIERLPASADDDGFSGTKVAE